MKTVIQQFIFIVLINLGVIMSAHANDVFISLPAEVNGLQKETLGLLKNYYIAMNKKDMKSFFDTMDEDVIHDINQGGSEQGLEKFKIFMSRVNDSFEEKLSDIVIMISDDGRYAASRWVDHGKYFKDYPGFEVKSKNQTYLLHGGHFFEIANGKISRVTTYYNVSEFMKQIK